MSEKTYVFEPSSGQMDAVTASLLGNRNNGLFGSNGLEGLIGLIIAAGIFGGNGNGWFGGGNNNNAEREMLMQAISRNGNDINSLASQFNCSTGQVMAAINGLSGAICNLGNQTGQNTNQIIMAILQGNNAITSQLASCCCDVKQAVAQSNYLTERGFCNTNQILAKGFSDIGYETQRQTCDLSNTIKDSTAQILAGQAAIEKREFQREIATLQEEKQTYKLGNMIAAATNPILAEVESIKCKLPKTETIVATPDYVPINRGINVNYAPYNCLTGFGFPYGFNSGNGAFF